MKKFTLISLVFYFAVNISFSQELNRLASYIKETQPTEYKGTIRKHAVEEWGSDHEMVIHEINTQCDAVVKLFIGFKEGEDMLLDIELLVDAMQRWTIDGYSDFNLTQLKKYVDAQEFYLPTLEQLLKLHCDWEMVKHEYDKQLKAKSAY